VQFYDTTQHVLAQRRLRALNEIASKAAVVRTVQDAAKMVCSVMGQFEDTPLAMLFSPDACDNLTVQASCNIPLDHVVLTSDVNPSFSAMVREAYVTARPITVHQISDTFGWKPFPGTQTETFKAADPFRTSEQNARRLGRDDDPAADRLARGDKRDRRRSRRDRDRNKPAIGPGRVVHQPPRRPRSADRHYPCPCQDL